MLYCFIDSTWKDKRLQPCYYDFVRKEDLSIFPCLFLVVSWLLIKLGKIKGFNPVTTNF